MQKGDVDNGYLNNLPSTAYEPSNLSRILLNEGFTGFMFSPSKQLNLPWPEYRPVPRQEVLYPVRLRAEGSVSFDLYTPGSTILPLMGLLNAYGKVIPGIPQMITLLFLWMKVCVVNPS